MEPEWCTGGVAGDTITFQTQLFADGRVQYNYQDLASARGQRRAPTRALASGRLARKGPTVVLAFNNGPNAFVGSGKSTVISHPPVDD